MNRLIKTLILIISVVLSIQCFAGGGSTSPFIIRVDTTITSVGSTNTKSFQIPANGQGFYNYNVDCNSDGVLEATGVNGLYTCDYVPLGGPGIYDISITHAFGQNTGFPHFKMANTAADRLKVIELKQWGKIQWQSMSGAFWGASNMVITATDRPSLNNVTSLSNMFNGATNANPILNRWNISSITSMNNMLASSGISITNYDGMLVNFFRTKPISLTDLDFGDVPVVKCSSNAQSAYTDLTNNSNWTINDQGVCNASNPLNDFVITVKTDIEGDTTDTQFNIKTNDFSTFVYNYNIDCNDDGSFEATAQTDDYTCVYGVAGTYTIRIQDNTNNRSGYSELIYGLGNPGANDPKKIIALEQWGTAHWQNLSGAFSGASNMVVNALDIPNFADVVKANTMFSQAVLANPDTYLWDVSNIQDMTLMFAYSQMATPDTSLWNTSEVINMGSMFLLTSLANPNTINWDTSKVENMSNMFYLSENANPNTTNWDVSSVSTMQSMFRDADMANPDTSLWVTTSLENTSRMFENNTIANPDVKDWDMSSATNLLEMFKNSSSANPDLSDWHIPIVNDFSNFLHNSGISSDNYNGMLINFNNQIHLDNLTLGNIPAEYCSLAAEAARDELINVDGWSLTDDGPCSAIAQSKDFVIRVNSNSAGETTNLQYMIPINTGNFAVDCQDDGIFETTNQTIRYTCNYASPDVYTIRIKDNSGNLTGIPRFNVTSNGDNLKLLSVQQWGVSIWTTFENAFLGAENVTISATDVPLLAPGASFKFMFFNAEQANPDTSNWDTENVVDMSGMFKNATMAQPDTSLWNTGNVEDMANMFENAVNANPDTSNWNTGKVKGMSRMFADAINANPETLNWDTALVENMSSMFNGATNANPNTMNWQTGNVLNMRYMFNNATSANPNTSMWDTQKVTSMSNMFAGASIAAPDTSAWNTSNVISMSHMFSNAIAAYPITSGWDISKVEGMTSIFQGITFTTSDYDAMLVHFAGQNIQNDVSFHGGGSVYCSVAAQNARNDMRNNHNWIIADAGVCAVNTPTFAADLTSSSDSGTSNSDDITSNLNPAFNIPCVVAGDDVHIYSDNPVVNSLIAVHVCVSQSVEIMTVTTALEDGANLITYTHLNNAGESMHSPSLMINIDSTDPIVNNINPLDTTSTEITGSISEGGAQINITGATCNNAPVTSELNGNFSCELSNPLTNGTNLTVSATDLAGNVSSTLAVTVNSSNIAPSFAISCDINATDVVGNGNATMIYPGFLSDLSVGPENESDQTYTLALEIPTNGDPDSVITDMAINHDGDLDLTINLSSNGVATLIATMQDSGDGNNTTQHQFNVYHFTDLSLDPVLPFDIIFRNNMGPCR